MNKFISLHSVKDNRIIGINVEDIVCAAVHDIDTRASQIYIDGDEDIQIIVNEKPTDILKRIGDSRKFILAHSKSSNIEIILPVDIIKTVKEIEDKGCRICITNQAFAEFDVNESATAIISRINEK